MLVKFTFFTTDTSSSLLNLLQPNSDISEFLQTPHTLKASKLDHVTLVLRRTFVELQFLGYRRGFSLDSFRHPLFWSCLFTIGFRALIQPTELQVLLFSREEMLARSYTPLLPNSQWRNKKSINKLRWLPTHIFVSCYLGNIYFSAVRPSEACYLGQRTGQMLNQGWSTSDSSCPVCSQIPSPAPHKSSVAQQESGLLLECNIDFVTLPLWDCNLNISHGLNKSPWELLSGSQVMGSLSQLPELTSLWAQEPSAHVVPDWQVFPAPELLKGTSNSFIHTTNHFAGHI